MALTFAAQVGAWATRANGALEAVFRESAEELMRTMDELLVQTVYAAPPAPSGTKRTGFLRASIVASTEVMPMLTRENPNKNGTYATDLGPLVLVINDAELGQTLYVGYTAKYAGFVHYSANGHAGRPWVDMAAQRWNAIVQAKAAEVKSRLGL